MTNKHNDIDFLIRNSIIKTINSIENSLDVLDFLDNESPTDDIQIILEKYKEKIKK